MIFSKQSFQFLVLIVVFIGLSITLGSIPTETLIDFVGSENVFLLMFALGVIGGLTTFTGIPYHIILMSFAAGGINPIGLGIATACGVMLGDSTMFIIGKKVKPVLSPRVLRHMNSVAKYLNAHPKLISPALVVYGALSPLSNDFVVASMSIMGYTYKKVLLPLTLGNIFYNIALAYLGLYAYDIVVGLF